MNIKILPKEVSSLLAAGQVIDSLAAVVRELVENSLDAKATRITISLWPSSWRVQVADNGMGMSQEDLSLCAIAHSTSKIKDKEDLHNITSLGFRGEALYSIAQLADLEIFSRQGNEQSGWGLKCIQGEVATETIPVAIAPGTIVTVSNLFSNWLVRRQGLPPKSQQLKAVQTTIYNMALCHPHITWQVKQNNRPWLNLSRGKSAKEILAQVLPQVELNDLQLSRNNNLELVLGLPDRYHRRRADWVKVAVNGRLVRSPELEQTIIAATSRTLPRDRYPVCFLHLHLSPSQIDWNRHPAKAEIYLNSLADWQTQISQAIEQALRITNINLATNNNNKKVGKLLQASEKKGTYHLENENNEQPIIELKAIAQVHNTYIVAEHESGMWLVEQHIAHERILYEQLQDNWELVPLETPIILNNLKASQIEQLILIGIDIEIFGEQLWAIRNIPKMLKERDDCQAALIELSQGTDLQQAQVATACRSAIRNGTPLNLKKMQNLLNQWQKTRNPRTCPHGRPIYLSLEETALAKFFRRHWVIGKSHGI